MLSSTTWTLHAEHLHRILEFATTFNETIVQETVYDHTKQPSNFQHDFIFDS